MSKENENGQTTKTSRDVETITHLCYVRMLSLISKFKLCESCVMEMLAQATYIKSEVEKESDEKVEVDVGLLVGLLRFGALPMAKWEPEGIRLMKDAITDVIQQPYFCQSCKLLLDEELSNLQNSTENENKKGIEKYGNK
jgi:hypothetical protein